MTDSPGPFDSPGMRDLMAKYLQRAANNPTAAAQPGDRAQFEREVARRKLAGVPYVVQLDPYLPPNPTTIMVAVQTRHKVSQELLELLADDEGVLAKLPEETRDLLTIAAVLLDYSKVIEAHAREAKKGEDTQPPPAFSG